MEVREQLSFKGTPERGWYELLDPRQYYPCLFSIFPSLIYR
jgi:hypothetical protein